MIRAPSVAQKRQANKTHSKSHAAYTHTAKRHTEANVLLTLFLSRCICLSDERVRACCRIIEMIVFADVH